MHIVLKGLLAHEKIVSGEISCSIDYAGFREHVPSFTYFKTRGLWTWTLKSRTFAVMMMVMMMSSLSS